MIHKHARLTFAAFLAAMGLLLVGAPGCIAESTDTADAEEEEVGEADDAIQGCPVLIGCFNDAECSTGYCKYKEQRPCGGVCLPAPADHVKPTKPEHVAH